VENTYRPRRHEDFVRPRPTWLSVLDLEDARGRTVSVAGLGANSYGAHWNPLVKIMTKKSQYTSQSMIGIAPMMTAASARP
jgi:hypothetical protein